MGSIVGKQVSIQTIIPLIYELLVDENYHVRLYTIKSLIKLAEVIGSDFMTLMMKSKCYNLT